MAKVVTSKHLDSISDLVVRARIRPGFVHTLDSISYASRVKLVAEALFDARASTREFQLVEPFADVTSRIQSLESFRIALLGDPPRELLLAATFDRGWEPYMRLIWRPLGTFLDLIFCNCEGYPLAATSEFADYAGWVRANQVDSAFFFAGSGLSVSDVQYLDQLERLQRESADCDPAVLAMRVTDPLAAAAAVRERHPEEAIAQGFEGLAVLYRLTDLYPPNTIEGDVLKRAARDLLAGWEPTAAGGVLPDGLKEPLAWFLAPIPAPAAPTTPKPAYDPTIVQAGIVSGFGTPAAVPNHGCLLLLGADSPAEARSFLAWLRHRISAETGSAIARASGAVQTSLGVTAAGLRTLGLGEDRIGAFPKEFLEGMEARAGLLGDVRASHPRRWALPGQNWPPGTSGLPPIELSEVDFVVQMRVHADAPAWDVFDTEREHPLRAAVEAVAAAAAACGVRLLAVETMRRATDGSDTSIEHFGFVDGISQPRLRLPDDPPTPGTLALGDILLGFENERGDAASTSPDLLAGSFLVIRKLGQDVPGLAALLENLPAGLDEAAVLAKMMGRGRDGMPLASISDGDLNAFNFAADIDGTRCPLTAHIRRTNPRTPEHGVAPPRLMRRGMSYGPPRGSNEPGPRGTFFMAYNASIAEQYEVVQRWVNGGNSTGAFSRQVDPIAGNGPGNQNYVYRFSHDGTPRRLTIAAPLVTLEWGMYLFVPSLTVIEDWATPVAAPTPAAAADPLVRQGNEVIARIRALPPGEQGLAWTMCIEDFTSRDPDERGEAGAVWAAIRATPDGVLRVPFGRGQVPRQAVLVARPDLVEKVLRQDQLYSMRDQNRRMRESFGEIFLGLDSGPQYEARSADTVALLSALTAAEGFAVARRAADAVLGAAPLTQTPHGEPFFKIDLRRDYLPAVLALVCKHWFGVPDGEVIKPGGWSWDDLADKPRCPGSFVAPSRFCFYPDPSEMVISKGRAHGAALTQAIVDLFLATPRVTLPDAAITKGLAAVISDRQELARTLVGVMIGFLPPAEANMRFALYGWTKDKTLHRVQRALLTSGYDDPFERARAALLGPLKRAMQRRPAPETLWRTAVVDHMIGKTPVQRDDLMIVGLVSATAQAALDGSDDVYPVFGGDRRAAEHPVHACPASRFAMGTMLGILSGVLEFGRIELLAAPLMVKITPGLGEPAIASEAI